MNPKNVYYGWWIVAAGFFISFYTTGVINFGFTAVFEPIVEEFGWSYTQISLATSLRGLETGLLAPVIGYLVDRWGTRKLLLSGTVILGFGFIFLGIVKTLLMFYIAYSLIAAGISTCGGVLFLKAVVNWFRKRATLASGFLTCGVAVGGLLVPLVTFTVDTLGWKLAMIVFGLGMWALCLPMAFVFKERPEEYDLSPEFAQDEVPETNEPDSQPTDEPDVLPTQAVKSRTFWHICLALSIQVGVISAVVTHIMPYLSSIGIDRTISSFMASAIPLFSILGRLGFGWLGDRRNKLRLSSLAFTFTCLGLFFFALIPVLGVWSLIASMLFMGVGWGSSPPIRVSLIKEFFGRRRFGTIHGFVMGIMMFGNIAGPPLAGLAFDNTGTYQDIWYIFAIVTILSCVIILTTPSVKKAEEFVE